MTTILCPDCEEPIRLESHPRMGQRITCAYCDAELEVIEVSPLELDWAYDEPEEEWEEEDDEDWEDEDDDDWDDEDDDWEDEDDADG